MKKTFRILTLLILLSLGTLAFAQTSNMSGIIREMSGTVEIKNPGAADFITANLGDNLNQDTIISTGFRSTALVELGSTIISVRPLTRLTLLEVSSSDGVENLNVNLQAGRVRVDVNPPAGTRASMSVSSPSATASVRGTRFWFDGRNLGVGEGMVEFQGRRGNNVTVNAGFVSGVDRDGKTTSARYTGAGRSNTSTGSNEAASDTEDTVVTLISNDSDAGLITTMMGLDPGSATFDIAPPPDPVPDIDPIPPPPPSSDPGGGNGGSNGGSTGGNTGGVTIDIKYD